MIGMVMGSDLGLKMRFDVVKGSGNCDEGDVR